MPKRRRPMSEMNVVPYIDVMLVLLIIFMITAPLLNLGVEVDLPQANADPLEETDPAQTVMITVKSNGDLYLNTEGAGELIDAESLGTTVAAIKRRNPEAAVLVGGDTRTEYGKVFEIMVLLQQAGVAEVGLMSDPAEDSS